MALQSSRSAANKRRVYGMRVIMLKNAACAYKKAWKRHHSVTRVAEFFSSAALDMQLRGYELGYFVKLILWYYNANARTGRQESRTTARTGASGREQKKSRRSFDIFHWIQRV